MRHTRPQGRRYQPRFLWRTPSLRNDGAPGTPEFRGSGPDPWSATPPEPNRYGRTLQKTAHRALRSWRLQPNYSLPQIRVKFSRRPADTRVVSVTKPILGICASRSARLAPTAPGRRTQPPEA